MSDARKTVDWAKESWINQQSKKEEETRKQEERKKHLDYLETIEEIDKMYQEGNHLIANANNDQAIDCYSNAIVKLENRMAGNNVDLIKNNDYLADLYYARGIAKKNTNEHHSAIGDHQNAISLHMKNNNIPKLERCYSEIITICEHLKKNVNVLNGYLTLIYLNPQSKNNYSSFLRFELQPHENKGYFFRGLLCGIFGKYDDALSAFRQFFKKKSANDIVIFRKAIKELEEYKNDKAVNNDKNKANLYFFLAEAYKGNNDFSKATEYYDKACTLDPKNEHFKIIKDTFATKLKKAKSLHQDGKTGTGAQLLSFLNKSNEQESSQLNSTADEQNKRNQPQ